MPLPDILNAIYSAFVNTAATAGGFLFPSGNLPDVSDTTALSDAPAYVPPFSGGQCLDRYNLTLSTRNFSASNSLLFTQATSISGVFGAILGTRSETFLDNLNRLSFRTFIRTTGGEVFHRSFIAGSTNRIEVDIVSLVRQAGTDNCGNLPNQNPVPSPPIPSGGVPQNGTPATTPSDQLVEAGLPVVFAPSVLSLLAGLAAQLGSALANAASAADALAATKAVAQAVGKLAEILEAHKETLDKLRKYLNKKEKEDAANRQYFVRQYGTILRDGYLDLTPRPAPVGFKPLMLDFLCANVPSGMGRFFGAKSYNWFRYEELGSICFLSPTSGVLSIHKIEHVRTSIAIPELAIGFTYNMGLNGIIRARVSMLYTQEKS